jgi:regulator of sigma E protease
MDFWIKAAQLFLSLAILVTLHELGHFLPARLFKTRVEKFYLFFNPWLSIFRTKKLKGKRVYSWFSKESPKSWEEEPNKTEWGLGWLPLGGYVKIAGMIDESMDKEQLDKPAEHWEFRSKPAWQRLIIMVGGVTVNLVLGFLIYIGVVFFWGKEEIKASDIKHGLAVHAYLAKYNIQSGDNIIEVDGNPVVSPNELNKEVLLRDAKVLTVQHPNGSKQQVELPDDFGKTLFQEGAFPLFSMRHKSTQVDSVIANTAAFKAGVKKGDKIIFIDEKPIEYFDEIQAALYLKKGKSSEIRVLRNADTVSLKAAVKEDGTIGFAPKSTGFVDSAAIKKVNYSLGESISVGMVTGVNTLGDYVSQFKFVFTKKGAGQMGGFAAIGNMFPPMWDWQQFWLTTAFLSIILAFMNILPIPALDGGHVVFLIYEMITGREPNKKVLEYAQYAGMILLLSLLVYANFNDLFRWLFPN